MIRLAVEAPAWLLPAVARETDLDFPIAHQVLEDKEYASHFRNREPGRECILDNGLHELGAAIPMADLLHAVDLIKPDYVVSPDRIGDPYWTRDQFRLLRENQPPCKIAVVLTGESTSERKRAVRDLADADMLCLPYDQPRFQWYTELFPYWRRVHLLGVSELSELQPWRPLSQYLNLSVDTGKPVKYGLLGKRLQELKSFRHASLRSKELLNTGTMATATSSETAIALVLDNLRYMRQHLA